MIKRNLKFALGKQEKSQGHLTKTITKLNKNEIISNELEKENIESNQKKDLSGKEE